MHDVDDAAFLMCSRRLERETTTACDICGPSICLKHGEVITVMSGVRGSREDGRGGDDPRRLMLKIPRAAATIGIA